MGKSEMISRGKTNYKDGLDRIGTTKWKECAKKGGMGTAVCLHLAKLEAEYDFSSWANRWETGMNKSGGE